MSYLRVMFPAPGFFISDTVVTLLVNQYPVFQGSFTQGFDWWTEMPPGAHLLEARIAAPLGITRSKMYTLEVRPGLTTIAVLDYSRMWGNFTSTPKSVTHVPP